MSYICAPTSHESVYRVLEHPVYRDKKYDTIREGGDQEDANNDKEDAHANKEDWDKDSNLNDNAEELNRDEHAQQEKDTDQDKYTD